MKLKNNKKNYHFFLLIPGFIMGFGIIFLFLFITNPPEDFIATLAVAFPFCLLFLGAMLIYYGRCRFKGKRPNRDILNTMYLGVAVCLIISVFSLFLFVI